MTPPTLTADSTNNDLAHNIEITFTDDATWRAAITNITINGEDCELNSYSDEAGKITIQWRNFERASTHAIAIIATGYDDAEISQVVTVAKWRDLTFFEVSENSSFPVSVDDIGNREPYWGDLDRKITIHDIIRTDLSQMIRTFWASWEKTIREGQSDDSFNCLNYIKNPRSLKPVFLFYAMHRLCLAQFQSEEDGYFLKNKTYYKQYLDAKSAVFPTLEFETPVTNYCDNERHTPRFVR